MNTYEITINGEVATGALTYMEALKKQNEMRRADSDAVVEVRMFMPVRRTAKVEAVPAKKELPIFKTMLDAGIEFTSKLTEPGYLFVAFRTEQTAKEIMESMNQQGFTVEICGNPCWIKVVQDY